MKITFTHWSTPSMWGARVGSSFDCIIKNNNIYLVHCLGWNKNDEEVLEFEKIKPSQSRERTVSWANCFSENKAFLSQQYYEILETVFNNKNTILNVSNWEDKIYEITYH